jgi:hypothetical protein
MKCSYITPKKKAIVEGLCLASSRSSSKIAIMNFRSHQDLWEELFLKSSSPGPLEANPVLLTLPGTQSTLIPCPVLIVTELLRDPFTNTTPVKWEARVKSCYKPCGREQGSHPGCS